MKETYTSDYSSAVALYSSSRLKEIIKETTNKDLLIACKRELLRRQGQERNLYTAAGESPLITLHKRKSLHAVQKF